MGELAASIDLPLGNASTSAARTSITAILGSWGFEDQEWLEDAQLVVTELVTNAIRHGGGLLELALQMHENQVVVSVSDGSEVLPEVRQPSGDSGRGLLIIEALTDGWGVENHHGGKRVWARLRAAPDDREST